MTDVDVLVVGAGPTGLTLAVALLMRGVRTAVLDRRADVAGTSRAAAVNARTLEVLQPLAVADRLIDEGLAAPRFTVRDGRRVLATVDFATLDSPYPFTLLVPQSTTERLLRERLRELGGTVRRPARLVRTREDPDGITAVFDDAGTTTARYLVGADGVHSTARQAAGIGFAGAGYPAPFVLADVALRGDAPTDEVRLFWARTGLTVVAPLPGGTFRVVAPVPGAPEDAESGGTLPEVTVGTVQQLLDDRLGGLDVEVTGLDWASRFHVQHRVADRFRAGRTLLAGDAAHVHSPAGGQGMNLGIQDAVALAEALTETLLGAGDPAPLDHYAATRRPIAGRVIRLTDRLTRLATMPAPAVPLRNALLRSVFRLPMARTALADQLSGVAYR